MSLKARILNQIKKQKPEIISILGPTAAGKTDLAFEIGTKYDYDLVSMDSRQVYKKMDIVTGKDIPKDFVFVNKGLLSYYQSPIGFRLYTTSIVSIKEGFSLGKLIRLLPQVIKEITNRKRKVVLVGGTIHWFYRLLSLSFDKVLIPEDRKWRQRVKSLSVEEIQKILTTKYPKKVMMINSSDWQNKRRLIRWYERLNYKLTPKDEKVIKSLKKWLGQTQMQIIINPNLQILKSRIYQRILNRIDAGALVETARLIKQYDTSYPAFDAPGYKQIIEFLNQKVDYDQMIQRWYKAEIQLVKKQKTWIKKIKSQIPAREKIIVKV